MNKGWPLIAIPLRPVEGTMERTNKQSEVAQLLNRIEEEYIAAQRGLTGLAAGARHAAITARMLNISNIHKDLHAIVGDEAIKLIAERLETVHE